VSKIVEMLLSSTGEIADAIRPLVEVAPGKEPGGELRKEEVPEVTAHKDEAVTLAGVRTLALRLPAPSPLLPFEKGQRRASEQYRMLRTRISQHPKDPRVIVVSSPAPGDGKSVSAINIAGALSLKSEGQVLLVDADLRRSGIHTQLGLPESPGLADVLKGACTLEEALVHTQDFPNLFVLSAGAPVENPVELLDSPRWQTLVAQFRSLFTRVVLDSPPVRAVADYDLIQAVSDGVILVVRPDHTNRLLCHRALEIVPKNRLLGVLLNCAPDWGPARHSGSRTDYYYYSGDKGYADRSATG